MAQSKVYNPSKYNTDDFYFGSDEADNKIPTTKVPVSNTIIPTTKVPVSNGIIPTTKVPVTSGNIPTTKVPVTSGNIPTSKAPVTKPVVPEKKEFNITDIQKPKLEQSVYVPEEKKEFKKEVFAPTHLNKLSSDPEYAQGFFTSNSDYSGRFGEQKKAADTKKVLEHNLKNENRFKEKLNKVNSEYDDLISKINSGNYSSTEISNFSKKIESLEKDKEELTSTINKYETFRGAITPNKEPKKESSEPKKESSKPKKEFDINDIRKPQIPQSQYVPENKTTSTPTNSNTTTTTSQTPVVNNKSTTTNVPANSAANSAANSQTNTSSTTTNDEVVVDMSAFAKPWNSPERMALAKKHGIENYTGTKEQNLLIMNNESIDSKPEEEETDTIQSATSNANKSSSNSDKTLEVKSSNTNVHYDELNKTGENYAGVVEDRADKLRDVIMDAADEQTNIEREANKIKTARSDETREELLDVTGEFKDNIEDRRDDVDDIVDRQERIANRQTNMSAASAGQYGDIYTDGAMANIKNDIIQKYGENILNAEQYAVNTNRSLDSDLLNVGLTEIEDKDKRDAFKNILLDKENSYMLNAIAEAAEGDKEAIRDISDFYTTYIKQKADNEAKRAGVTELRAGMEDEYDSLDASGKAGVLRGTTSGVAGYSIIADQIPALINKYPNATLSELEAKVAKVAELALTAKQQLPTIIAKAEEDRTEVEKDLLLTYGTRGLEEQVRSDRNTSETLAQQEANDNGELKTTDTLFDANEDGQQTLEQSIENKKISNKNKRLRTQAYKKLEALAKKDGFSQDKIDRLKKGIDERLPIIF